jgi:hypothetical protein
LTSKKFKNCVYYNHNSTMKNPVETWALGRLPDFLI